MAAFHIIMKKKMFLSGSSSEQIRKNKRTGIKICIIDRQEKYVVRQLVELMDQKSSCIVQYIAMPNPT